MVNELQAFAQTCVVVRLPKFPQGGQRRCSKCGDMVNKSQGFNASAPCDILPLNGSQSNGSDSDLMLKGSH